MAIFSKKMKVLMISCDEFLSRPCASSEDAYGVHYRHVTYSRHYEKLFIFTPSFRRRKEYQLSPACTVFPVYTPPLFSWVYPFLVTVAAAAFCLKEKTDVITVQDPYAAGLPGLLLSRIFTLPLNVQLQGDFLNNPAWLKERFLNRLFNMIGMMVCRRADSIRYMTERVRKKLVKLGVPEKKFLKYCSFTPAHAFLKHGLIPDHVKEYKENASHLILTVARLSLEKNISLIVRAAAIVVKKMPAVTFIFIGDGPERIPLARLADSLALGHACRFLGVLPHRKLPHFYSLADIFVLCSTHEGYGQVFIEALLSGCPVIMSDVGVAREVVIDGVSGCVLPNPTEESLADHIIALLGNLPLRKLLSEKGRQLAATHDNIERDAHQLREIYAKTIAFAQERY